MTVWEGGSVAEWLGYSSCNPGVPGLSLPPRYSLDLFWDALSWTPWLYFGQSQLVCLLPVGVLKMICLLQCSFPDIYKCIKTCETCPKNCHYFQDHSLLVDHITWPRPLMSLNKLLLRSTKGYFQIIEFALQQIVIKQVFIMKFPFFWKKIT